MPRPTPFVITAPTVSPSIVAALTPGNYGALARASGISRPHISRIARGLAKPSGATAMRLAEAVGCTVEELFARLYLATPRVYSRQARRTAEAPP